MTVREGSITIEEQERERLANNSLKLYCNKRSMDVDPQWSNADPDPLNLVNVFSDLDPGQ